MSSVPAGQHSSGTPYGPRVNSIGSGTLWSLGVKTTVWRRTPSRIGNHDFRAREVRRRWLLGGPVMAQEGRARCRSHGRGDPSLAVENLQ